MFGAFQYALALVLLFSSLSFICGIEVVLPKLVNATDKDKSEIVTSAFILRLLSAFLGMVIFVLYLRFSTSNTYSLSTLLFLGIIIFLREPFNIVVSLLQARTDEKIGVLLRLIALAVKLIGIFLCYKVLVLTGQLAAFLWYLEALIIAVGLCFLIKIIEPNLKFKFSIKYSKALLSQGVKFWLGLVFMYLFLRVDRIFLQHFTDLEQVGLYSAAMQISDNVATIAPIVAISTAPTLIYSVKSLQKLRSNVIVLTSVMACLGLLIATTGIFLSDFIIDFVFGANYSSSTHILKMTLCVSVLVFIDAGLNTFVIKYGNGRVIIFKWLLALSASILFNTLFINKLGVMSVIYANAIGYLLAILFGVIYIFRFNYGAHND